MAALPSYSDLQDQLAARAHQSPRFAELLRSPPALPRRVQSLRQWQTELERRSPSKAPLSPAGGLAEGLGSRLAGVGAHEPEPEPEPEPQPQPEARPREGSGLAVLSLSSVGGAAAPTAETVREMDELFAQRLGGIRLGGSPAAAAAGLLPPRAVWEGISEAAGGGADHEPALRRIAELAVASPSAGATQDEFGIAVHLARGLRHRSDPSLTPAGVASLRRIWQLHRTVMETQVEVRQLRGELHIPEPASPATSPTAASLSPRPGDAKREAEAEQEEEEEGSDPLERGMRQLLDGQYSEAARSFSLALQRTPDDSAALRGLHEATKGVQMEDMAMAGATHGLAGSDVDSTTALGQAMGWVDWAGPGEEPPQAAAPEAAAGPTSPVVAEIRRQTRRERLLRRTAVAAAAAEEKTQRKLAKAKGKVEDRLARANIAIARHG